MRLPHLCKDLLHLPPYCGCFLLNLLHVLPQLHRLFYKLFKVFANTGNGLAAVLHAGQWLLLCHTPSSFTRPPYLDKNNITPKLEHFAPTHRSFLRTLPKSPQTV